MELLFKEMRKSMNEAGLWELKIKFVLGYDSLPFIHSLVYHGFSYLQLTMVKINK